MFFGVLMNIRYFLLSAFLSVGLAYPVLAEEVALLEMAKGEQLASAVGHYARARSLLMAALREFDKGTQLVNPDSILDSKVFRENLIERATDLEKVLDPQPRITQGGVRFEPDPRLLGEAKK